MQGGQLHDGDAQVESTNLSGTGHLVMYRTALETMQTNSASAMLGQNMIEVPPVPCHTIGTLAVICAHRVVFV